MIYLSGDEYSITYGGKIPDADVGRYLAEASRQIDVLTFGRIPKIGWDNLTENQQNLIKQAAAAQADMLYEYADIFQTPLSGYSINGVSMSFGQSTGNLDYVSGVPVMRGTYETLKLTGLCCRMI